jgi:hypothetical protein
VFDNKTWVRFDEIAGSLLDTSADRWATILRRADTFTDKDYEKVFALTALFVGGWGWGGNSRGVCQARQRT